MTNSGGAQPQTHAARSRASYNGLTPAEFASEVGVSTDTVYALIEDGWFSWTKDRGRSVPECVDNRKVGAARPLYKIHRNALDRWFKERAMTGKAG